MRDREIVELSKKLEIRPPGAMHQTSWMAKAIYSLKICLLQPQFKISAKDKRNLQDVSLFSSLTVKASNQDVCFLKALKTYEEIDKSISKAALSKFCQHICTVFVLWNWCLSTFRRHCRRNCWLNENENGFQLRMWEIILIFHLRKKYQTLCTVRRYCNYVSLILSYPNLLI